MDRLKLGNRTVMGPVAPVAAGRGKLGLTRPVFLLNDELRFYFPHIIKQKGEIRVINRLAREWNKTVSTPAQFSRTVAKA